MSSIYPKVDRTNNSTLANIIYLKKWNVYFFEVFFLESSQDYATVFWMSLRLNWLYGWLKTFIKSKQSNLRSCDWWNESEIENKDKSSVPYHEDGNFKIVSRCREVGFTDVFFWKRTFFVTENRIIKISALRGRFANFCCAPWLSRDADWPIRSHIVKCNRKFASQMVPWVGIRIE